MASVGIVGGGIAGAAAAFALRDDPVAVTLFEASDRLGGRMVTRERDGCTYDYGANFVKADEARIATILRAAAGDDLVTVDGETRVFDADGTISAGRADQAPKYTTRRGVRGIVEAFARESGATVATDTRVGHLDRRGDGWRLATTGGREERVDGLVLALPAGETASQLADAEWGHPLKDDLLVAAEGVPHRPVDSVVCHYPERIEKPYYALVASEGGHDVGWCSREECKPGHVPDGESLLVVQLNPQWTATHPDAHSDEIAEVARSGAHDLLGDDRVLNADWIDHARFTAAVPEYGADPDLIARTRYHDLAVAGDWVAGAGRTYAALRTGLAAAETIRERVVA
ncbi:NAD(P)/FAD-dependent oxidoreductase [Halorientalis halophila]|uniref:NAD(P)/FAD-dependent oxidoreductase n=1 Tax=Halorientalis halophila TaxID=3108499 RepID=UPI003009F71F